MKLFLTGTRAFGPAREDSDWDVVMLYEDQRVLRSLLSMLLVLVHDASEVYDPSSYYFELDGKIVNIIPVDDIEEFWAWRHATEQMRKREPIEDREERIDEFNRYKEELRKQLKR